MIGNFYKTPSNDKEIGKILTNETQISIQLKEPCDILNPTIILTYSSSNEQFNYVYLSEFNRYYFITKKIVKDKRLILECEVDVLESYKSQILDSNCLVTRAEISDKKAIFHDVYYPVRVDRVIQVPVKIGTVGTDVKYYLTVCGGGV